MYQGIYSYELVDIMDNDNINLVDIRDPYVFSLGTIKNAKNIPFNNLILNPTNYLDKKKKYYLFCNSGSNSYNLCNYLTRLGYNVINIIDGYQGYRDSVI